MRSLFVLAAIISISACTQSSVTQVARNQFLVSTSAAPVCGGTGAQRVAARLAAAETIRQGFERYIIVSGGAENNVGVYRTGPTFANTTGNFTASGNMTHFNGSTYFGGQQTIIHGTHDASLMVAAFNQGDPGYENAVDAKQALGPEWEQVVKNGVKTCSE